jgi:hypothetical protein
MDNTQIPTTEQLQELLSSSTNLEDRISSAMTPALVDRVQNLVREGPPSDLMRNVPPEVLAKARQMAAGAAGNRIKSNLTKQGVNAQQLAAEMRKNKRRNRALRQAEPSSAAAAADVKYRVIVITQSRQVREKEISASVKVLSVQKAIVESRVVSAHITNLARGPLTDKEVKIWYNPDSKMAINRRAKKLVNFDIRGNVLIEVPNESLTISVFEKIEQQALISPTVERITQIIEHLADEENEPELVIDEDDDDDTEDLVDMVNTARQASSSSEAKSN